MLTARLAPRCDRLLACDAVPDAVASARARTAGLPGVLVEQRVIPGTGRRGAFDLIVFSELLYYFDDADLTQVLRLGIGALRPDGHLLAVHWRHPAPDHPRTGDEVHAALAATRRAGAAGALPRPGLHRRGLHPRRRRPAVRRPGRRDRVIRSVGVIVPAHNEQDLLPACLASLRRAARALRGMPVHLVVVADACRDRTGQVARRGGRRGRHDQRPRASGAARAAGAREVLRRTRHLDPADVWLATTDADTLVPALLAAPAGTLRRPGLGRGRRHDRGGRLVRPTGRDRDRCSASGTRPEPGRTPTCTAPTWASAASAYLAAGGFPGLPTGEDHALVAALTVTGSRVLRTRALPVITSARRESRAPGGFGDYLGQLDSASA